MKPEQFATQLQEQLGETLQSVVLYGSAAGGDYTRKQSDYNLLITLSSLELSVLDQLAPSTRAWVRAGHPAPLLFTPERLRQSADVFPVELSDLRDARRILYGPDPLEGISIDPAHLRRQVEHELKGRLIQLRRAYLTTHGRPRAVRLLLLEAYSGVCVLLRAALRLFAADVPMDKLAAVEQLAARLEFSPAPFREVHQLKTGGTLQTAPGPLFEQFINATERVADAVDAVEESLNN